jgi:hypothetical protein
MRIAPCHPAKAAPKTGLPSAFAGQRASRARAGLAVALTNSKSQDRTFCSRCCQPGAESGLGRGAIDRRQTAVSGSHNSRNRSRVRIANGSRGPRSVSSMLPQTRHFGLRWRIVSNTVSTRSLGRECDFAATLATPVARIRAAVGQNWSSLREAEARFEEGGLGNPESKSMIDPVSLDADSVERVAQRVVARLGFAPAKATAYLSACETSRRTRRRKAGCGAENGAGDPGDWAGKRRSLPNGVRTWRC